ncbi:MAG: DUF2752 domain-containing protein [Turicibacter sp.]|nr:DUF2752 domain-containing protein [Turicibacter sp.]
MDRLRSCRLLIYLLFVIFIYQIPLEWIENRRLCLWYHFFQLDCFGCGFTRAFFSFIHGQFEKAVLYNKMVLIVLGALAIICQDCFMILSHSKTLSWLEFILIRTARWVYPNLKAFKKLG